MAAKSQPESRKTGLRLKPRQFRYRTFAGTIARGMDVLDAQNRCIGQVESVESDHIMLARARNGREYFVPLTLIDGIHGDQVLLAGRGDSTFGLGAQP